MTNDEFFAWFELDNLKKYYKDGKLHGLIGTMEKNGLLMVCATARDENIAFSIGMLKDIILLYNTRVICLVTDVESKQELIRKALTRYNFRYEYENGNMFSIGGKEW